MATDKPMNLLILMDDQHRHDALSCANHPHVKTPNLDALAASGVRFTQAVANLPICVPCRHSFITGYYAHQIGILSNQHSWEGDPPVPTLGQVLQDAGYATASIGKMHWKTATTKRGFDFRAVRSDGESPDEPVDLNYEVEEPDRMAQYLSERADYVRGGECHPGYVGQTSKLTGDELPEAWLCDLAVDYLGKHPKDQPFCMMVSLDLPHPANVVPKDYEGFVKPEDITLPPEVPEGFQEEDDHVTNQIATRWADMTEDDIRLSQARYFTNVSYVDQCLGRVLNALKEQGLEENTLVVFFSDHGEMLGERNRTHTKYSLYENAVRAPLIVRWPGRSQAGHVCDASVELVDLMPTWLEAAGLPISNSLPGRSLAPLLEGASSDKAAWRSSTLAEMYTSSRPQWMLRESRYKLIERQGGNSALFDLQQDPNEFENRIEDPELADIRDRMRLTLLERVMSTTQQGANRLKPAP